MTRVRHYALLFMILAMIATGSYANSPIVIKFSHVKDPDSPKGLAAAYFKKVAEYMTQGRVNVIIYPNSQLYPDTEALEALQLGAVHMLAPSPSKISMIGLHEFEIFDVPYLFPDKEAVYRVTQGPIGERLLSKLETKGMVGLGFWDNGYKSMFSNKPIRVPNDMRGLKMRVDPSRVLATQMERLDAEPYTITFPDMVQLLRRNTIDGTESTPSNLYSQSHVALPKYMAVTNHGYLGYVVVANKKFWRKLPPEIRAQLMSAIQETTRYANKTAYERNKADMEAIKASRNTQVYELTDADKALWREALMPVRLEMESHIGADLVKDVHEAISNRSQ